MRDVLSDAKLLYSEQQWSDSGGLVPLGGYLFKHQNKKLINHVYFIHMHT